MRRLSGIIESPVAPLTNMMWLYRGELRYFSNGQWVLVGNNPVTLNNTVEGASVVAPVIKLGNTTEDKQNNIKVCTDYSTTDVISIDVEGIFQGVSYDAVGIYHNGTVSILEGNHCTVFDINFNTGEVTLDSKYDTSKFLPYVDLEIGNSTKTKAYNIERLQTGTFFCRIDYGFGVGTWNSTNGGSAHIVTAYGNMVYYSISNDGIVAKMTESPDLYYEYTQMGGSKTPTQFSTAIANLVGI